MAPSNKQLTMLKTRVKQLAVQHKKIVGMLKNKVKEEMEKTTIAQRQFASAEVQIEVLKQNLKDGISAESYSSKKRNSGEDIEALKNAAYAEAQIISLKEELKREIEKSSKVVSEYETQLIQLKRGSKETESDTDEKISKLEENLSQTKVSLEEKEEQVSKIAVEFEEKIVVLQTECDEQKQTVEARDKTIVELSADQKTARDDLQELQSSSSSEIIELKKSVEEKEEYIKKAKMKYEELNADFLEQIDINKKYDVIKIFEELRKIKKRAPSSNDGAGQIRIKQVLDDLLVVKEHSKIFDKDINAFTSTIFNEIMEIEQKLRNQIFVDEPESEYSKAA